MNSDQIQNDPVEEVTTDQGETTVETAEDTTLESGEDVNAQVEDETVEVEEQSQEEEELEVPRTRWEDERKNWIEGEREMQARLSQARIIEQPQMGNYAAPVQVLAQSQAARLEQELLWMKAHNSIPELKDREFEDLVFETYQAQREFNPALTPTDVAVRLKRVIAKQSSKISKEAYQKAENNITQKLSGSRGAPKRSNTPPEEQRGMETKKAMDRYAQTGREEDLYDLFDY